MDLIALTVVVIVGIAALATFDVLALRYGTDSRDSLGDDRRRPLLRP